MRLRKKMGGVYMTRGFMGSIGIDLADFDISADRDEYARWSVRAKLRLLAALGSKGRDYNIHPARWSLTATDAPDLAQHWLSARKRYAVKRAKKERRFVVRAVPGPWVRALRSELRGIAEDFSKPWPRLLTFRERLAAAWKAWNVRYDR